MHTLDKAEHFKCTLILLDEYRLFRKNHGDKLPEKNLRHLNECIHWSTANVLQDALTIDKQTALSTLTHVKEDGLYPYPLLWRRLTLKYGIRCLIVNLMNLPLKYEVYYHFMAWLKFR